MVFTSNREHGGYFSVYWRSADGTGKEELLGSATGRSLLPWSFSSDGKTRVLDEMVGSEVFDIGVRSMDGDHTRKPLLQEKHTEVQPKISPDGQWMAYCSWESGLREIYVRPFPEVDKRRWQVSTRGGDSPLWSPNGQELFYLNEGSVMAVAVEKAPNLSFGTPKTLFRGSYIGAGTFDGTPWDIHPDGKRFLMIKPPAPTGAAPTSTAQRKINIVLNWFEELKQRAPVK